MKTIKKAQTGANAKKKVDSNTTIQKLKLDNKYNSIYRAMQNDSIKESNKILPETYERLRRKNSGKSPSAEELRAAQDKYNKEIVKDSKANKRNTKLDARGRTENAMIMNAINSQSRGKNGKNIKKAKAGGKFDLNKDGKTTFKDVLIGRGVLPKKAKSGAALKKQAATAIAMKKAGKSPKKATMGAMAKPMMKSGGSMKKCRYGCK